ncbi:hypothetical protein Rhal01_03853 [Rubritalea halochordaticola]|uniref:Uncharacterized protein n=1 Tax=Rubritalea halochordaticola TaxID=714537 RepID=A0ABP9V4Z9_9BACT
MRRPKVGDVIEVPANGGYYYGVVSHRHDYGDVLRIINKCHALPLKDIPAFEAASDMITLQCIFKGELTNGSLKKVGKIALPEKLRDFPLFRSGTPNHKTGKVEVWWLWDGENDIRIGELSEEQKQLPRAGALDNEAMVIHLERRTHPSLL